MGQVSGKISPSPLSGRPRYNLDDYIRERDPYKERDEMFGERRKDNDSIVTQEQV